MPRIVINILGFQIAWWACVLLARADAAWVGLGVAVAAVALHLAVSPARASEAWFIPLAAMLGYTADTAATLLGALDFEVGRPRALPAPIWVAALWLAFATTLNTGFAWMRDRIFVAAAVGAASGPLAYAAGAALGIVILPQPIWSVVVLATLWGITLPILVLMASRTVRTRRAADAVPQQCTGGAS